MLVKYSFEHHIQVRTIAQARTEMWLLFPAGPSALLKRMYSIAGTSGAESHLRCKSYCMRCKSDSLLCETVLLNAFTRDLNPSASIARSLSERSVRTELLAANSPVLFVLLGSIRRPVDEPQKVQRTIIPFALTQRWHCFVVRLQEKSVNDIRQMNETRRTKRCDAFVDFVH